VEIPAPGAARSEAPVQPDGQPARRITASTAVSLAGIEAGPAHPVRPAARSESPAAPGAPSAPASAPAADTPASSVHAAPAGPAAARVHPAGPEAVVPEANGGRPAGPADAATPRPDPRLPGE